MALLKRGLVPSPFVDRMLVRNDEAESSSPDTDNNKKGKRIISYIRNMKKVI